MPFWKFICPLWALKNVTRALKNVTRALKNVTICPWDHGLGHGTSTCDRGTGSVTKRKAMVPVPWPGALET